MRGRALLAFAVGAAIAGGVLAISAFRSGPDSDAAVLQVDDAIASVVPVTIPPLATVAPDPAPTIADPSADPDDPDGSDDRPDDDRAPTPSTTPSTPPSVSSGATSPLAELLGPSGSAIPPVIEPRLRPVGLRIDEIFVDDPIRPVGLEDDGQLEVPGATEIGWYRYGAAPGYAGATVLAAHVTWNGDYGPFLNLGEVGPGDQVTVGLENGSERVYEVIERTMYDKDELPRDRIWRNTGPETLVLITCGGDFNPDVNRYRQNIVVYAVPVA